MKKAIFAIFTILTIFITFGLNINEVKADTKECNYDFISDAGSKTVDITITLTNGIATAVKGTATTPIPGDTFASFDVKDEAIADCPDKIYSSCTSRGGDYFCTISFVPKTNFRELSQSSSGGTNPNPGTNPGGNSGGNSGGGNSGPTQGTVLNTIACGNTNLPEALPGLTRFIVTLIQVVTPLIMIIMGTIDFAKATIGSDEKEMNKAKEKFTKRLIAGVVVFLAFTVIKFAVGIIAIDNEASIMKCVDCLIASESSCG